MSPSSLAPVLDTDGLVGLDDIGDLKVWIHLQRACDQTITLYCATPPPSQHSNIAAVCPLPSDLRPLTHLLAVLQDALLGADAALGAAGVGLPLPILDIDVHIEFPTEHGHLRLGQQPHGAICWHLVETKLIKFEHFSSHLFKCFCFIIIKQTPMHPEPTHPGQGHGRIITTHF